MLSRIPYGDTLPLLEAARAGRVECIKLLISSGADPNEVDFLNTSPLMSACARGYAASIECLIAAGSNLDYEAAPSKYDRGGGIAAISACCDPLDNPKCLKLLIESEASLNIQNRQGKSPLMQAAWRGNSACLEYLLECGALINLEDEDGWTALMCAASEGYSVGHVKCIKMLIDKGASTNSAAKIGRTPLRAAIENWGSTPVVDLLKHHGAKR